MTTQVGTCLAIRGDTPMSRRPATAGAPTRASQPSPVIANWASAMIPSVIRVREPLQHAHPQHTPEGALLVERLTLSHAGATRGTRPEYMAQ